jgi:hypothetical protein
MGWSGSCKTVAMTDHKRILALSKDRGSVQAIVPVVAELRARLFPVSLVIPSGCHELATAWGLESATLEVADFIAAPEIYMARLFDEVNPAVLLAGTSPAKGCGPETPEQFAIREARQRGIPSITVLDYWGMYSERFCAADGSVDDCLLPDRLCALDSRCREDLLRLGIPAGRVEITHNPWLDGILCEASVLPPPSRMLDSPGWRVLFVSQPLSKWLSPESPLPQYKLLQSLVAALPSGRHRVIVWKHPAEPTEQWQNIDQFGVGEVEVCLTEERGPALLAHVDLLVSVHSTTVHEALHYGTPCLSLRIGLSSPSSYAEKLGLADTAKTLNALQAFLASADPQQLRRRLRERSRRLRDEGLFFSDGKATKRVTAAVLAMFG